jgi:hypothetical protein
LATLTGVVSVFIFPVVNSGAVLERGGGQRKETLESMPEAGKPWSLFSNYIGEEPIFLISLTSYVKRAKKHMI